MPDVVPKDFTFNASALGLGGVLEYDDRTIVVPSLASVALPPTGGEGSVVVENYSRDGVSFTRAESRVTGYPVGKGATHTTYCDILITNLNLFDTLKVAMMTASLTSTHSTPDESRFELRAMYRGVQIGDDEIVPEYDLDLVDCSTYELFAKRVTADRALESYAEQFDVPKKKLAAAAQNQQPLHGAIVKELRGGAKDLERKAHKIIVPGFGKLHFGELLVKPGRRRLNLLRIDFTKKGKFEGGSTAPTGGAMTLGSGDGNGVPVWP